MLHNTQDELLATRKDIMQGTLKYFRKQCEGCGDVKEALKVRTHAYWAVLCCLLGLNED